MLKHTKGPWKYLSATKESLPTIYVPNPIVGATMICTVSMRVEQEANARLIAAAPDLLKTLIKLNDCLTEGISLAIQPGSRMALEIRDIIAKAKGVIYDTTPR